ncbi:protein kinase [Streptacidiphilus jiangxiensis]|uniref:Protein tyrosine kinase n=1 Tax=Streptacidiphilus jiangxiensis TaxID=235985 RepID=A0A1H7M995_STRJI|nr:protein kinase [Streptacidiphilus jiangxiensis]SEL07701.1 Protein tyrosine kinase [Streptacidiphilus jiangxiensis]
MAKASGGRLLAERYQLTERRRGGAVEARDLRSGAPVLLEAVPLPELVTPFDQDGPGGHGLPGGPGGFEGAGDGVVDDGGDARSTALRHAATAARAVPDHPRLSQVFQVFAEDGYLWVAGEWVAGAPLAQVLERAPLSPYRAAELAYDVSAGLEVIHRAGLVHGNLTPATVTVCEDGAALLGGLAAAAAQEALCGGPGAVEAGASVPTSLWSPARVRARDARAVIVGAVPERWAPEQLGIVGSAGLPVGPAVDTWALGVLLYRSVTGVPPYPEGGVEELFAAVRAGFRPDTRPAGPLRPLLDRLLDQDPARRPGLAQVRAALRQLLLRAPEPLDREAQLAALPPGAGRGGAVELPTGTRLPAPRPGGLPAQRSRASSEMVDRRPERHHHAAPRRRGALLGPVLVGAIILVVLVTLALAANLKG